MIIVAVANSLIEDRVAIDRHPLYATRIYSAAFDQLTFLNLQVNDTVLFEETNASHDPAGWKEENLDLLIQAKVDGLTYCW